MSIPDWTDLTEDEQKMYTNLMSTFDNGSNTVIICEDDARIWAIEAFTIAAKLIKRHIELVA